MFKMHVGNTQAIQKRDCMIFQNTQNLSYASLH